MTTIKQQSVLVKMLLIASLLTHVITVAGSGLKYSDGYTYFQINAEDGIMHLAFINSLTKSVPPIQPGAYPLTITNYHYLGHLILAVLAKTYQLPINHLLFHYLPPLLSLLTSFGIIAYLGILTKSKLTPALGLVLLNFSGGIGYLFQLFTRQSLDFSRIPIIDAGVIQMVNLPQAIAKVVFFAGLILLSLYLQKPTPKSAVLTGISLALLFGYKVYFGLFAALGLATLVVVYLANQLRQTPFPAHFFKLLGSFAIMTGVVYLPVNSGSGGLFFIPNAWPKVYFAPEKLNWIDWWLRQQVYEAAGNTRNIILFNLILFTLFIILVYGNRLFALLPSSRVARQITLPIYAFLYVPTLLFSLIGSHSLQTSGEYNTFNFLTVSLITAVILSTLQLTTRRIPPVIIMLLIAIGLAQPLSSLGEFIQSYSTYRNRQTISNQEIAALDYIKHNTPSDSIVQAHPKRLLDYYTPYIPFFADRYGYISGRGLLNSHNQPINGRTEALQRILSATDSATFATFRNITPVDYIIYENDKDHEPRSMPGSQTYDIVFQNQNYSVIKLN